MIALALMLAQVSTIANGKPVHATTFGGQQSCAAALEPSVARIAWIWMAGFWSGLNIANAFAVGEATDIDGIEGEVRKLCEAQPSLRFDSAVMKATS